MFVEDLSYVTVPGCYNTGRSKTKWCKTQYGKSRSRIKSECIIPDLADAHA